MDRINVVGVDVGKTEHYAVGLDAAGANVLSRPLPNDQVVIDELVSWAATNTARIVVDQPTGGAGLLVAACWEAGVPIGYLHGLAMARARDFYEGEAKTDPKDAFVIADVARAHPMRIVELTPVPEERATLELLCGADEDLRGDVNRATNRLRQLLTTHWPALERLLGARLASRSICQLLASHPGADPLRQAGRARIKRFLKTRRIRKADEVAAAIIDAIEAQHTIVPGSAAAGRLVATLAEELDRLHARRDEIGKEIEACFFALPEAPILLSLPGIGPRLGARILVEVGDIARFASPSKLASFAGLGPSLRQSGTSINGAVPSRRGNHRLKNAMFLAAFASLRHPPSRTYYDRKRAQGKGHNQAVMCLARRRVDVIHAMLTRHELYRWNPSPDPDQEAQAA